MKKMPAGDKRGAEGPLPGTPGTRDQAGDGQSPVRTGDGHRAVRAAGPDGPVRAGGADPVPRALTVVSVLLTIGTATTDVACFTRLGSVFASVMTSNIVFLGLSAARHSGPLATRAGASVAAYVIGVAAASRLARTGRRHSAPHGSAGSAGAGASGGQPWSAWIVATLLPESVLLAVFTAGWEITGAKPEGGTQLLLLATVAAAMGSRAGWSP